MERKMNELKIELLKAIIACDDIEKLNKVKVLLNDEAHVLREDSILYEKDILSAEQYQELERRLALYEGGKAETLSFDEVKARLNKKYGV
ncbi:addiction module protein [Mesonia aquimarina]|uniref:addiction module protein n=1 Tax=Mesonia aquimarina TaxID=1504967 RepID=UPI000EF56723|nr:addiction module protein [Mesonia aquimarina]